MNARRIGLEYEFLAIQDNDGQAITRDIIKSVWRDWSREAHVSLYVDYATQQPVGVLYTGQDGREFLINTDAGTNVVEFAFEPFESLSDSYANMSEILREFQRVASKYSAVLTGMGLQPKTPYFLPDLKTEKIWYRAITRLPIFATLHDFYHNIAAHQVTIDVTYDEVIPALNVLNAIGGVTIALFANSGFGEWKVQDHHSTREYRWDQSIAGHPDHVQRHAGIPKKPFSSFRDYLEYNWSLTLPCISREPTLHLVEPAPTISEYLRGEAWPAFDVGRAVTSQVIPEMRDVNDLSSYVWTQARAKYFFKQPADHKDLLGAYEEGRIDEFAEAVGFDKLYIEVRNIGAQPWDDIMAAPAFIAGLVENLDASYRFIQSREWDWWRALRTETVRSSLQVAAVHQVAESLLDIAAEGLRQRARGEGAYLAPLYSRLERRTSPAMQSIRDVEQFGIEGYIDKNILRL